MLSPTQWGQLQSACTLTGYQSNCYSIRTASLNFLSVIARNWLISVNRSNVTHLICTPNIIVKMKTEKGRAFHGLSSLIVAPNSLQYSEPFRTLISLPCWPLHSGHNGIMYLPPVYFLFAGATTQICPPWARCFSTLSSPLENVSFWADVGSPTKISLLCAASA